MLVYAKKLVGYPIVESVGMAHVGIVSDIVVDPNNIHVMALLIGNKPLFSRKKVVILADIRGVFKDGILVKDSDCVADSSDIVRIDAILRKHRRFIGSAVFTNSGLHIGRIEDVIFDLDIAVMINIVVKKRFSSERRIISAERITSILPNKIIVRDVLERRLINKIGKRSTSIPFAN